MKPCLPLALALLLVPAAGAQESPYVDEQGRSIKAVSAERVEGYLAGAGLSYALAAELNSYPGPRHALELREQLELSGDQIAELERLFDGMNAAARELGAEIVRLERRLDAAFSARTIDRSTLEALTGEIAGIEGRLRFVHLAAHLETTLILTEHQVATYDRLRGYSERQHDQHQHGD